VWRPEARDRTAVDRGLPVLRARYGHAVGLETRRAPLGGRRADESWERALAGRSPLQEHMEKGSAATEQLGAEVARSSPCNTGLLGVDTAEAIERGVGARYASTAPQVPRAGHSLCAADERGLDGPG
jgi:hypothetical protein